jgi:hypothetical protein
MGGNNTVKFDFASSEVYRQVRGGDDLRLEYGNSSLVVMGYFLAGTQVGLQFADGVVWEKEGVEGQSGANSYIVDENGDNYYDGRFIGIKDANTSFIFDSFGGYNFLRNTQKSKSIDIVIKDIDKNQLHYSFDKGVISDPYYYNVDYNYRGLKLSYGNNDIIIDGFFIFRRC